LLTTLTYQRRRDRIFKILNIGTMAAYTAAIRAWFSIPPDPIFFYLFFIIFICTCIYLIATTKASTPESTSLRASSCETQNRVIWTILYLILFAPLTIEWFWFAGMYWQATTAIFFMKVVIIWDRLLWGITLFSLLLIVPLFLIAYLCCLAALAWRLAALWSGRQTAQAGRLLMEDKERKDS
jgi:hypothetical protein